MLFLLYSLLTSHHSTRPKCIFLALLYSSTKRSANNCLQKTTILRGGEAGGELFNVTIETSSAYSLADKWQKSKYLKRNFSVLCFLFFMSSLSASGRTLISLETPWNGNNKKENISFQYFPYTTLNFEIARIVKMSVKRNNRIFRGRKKADEINFIQDVSTQKVKASLLTLLKAS